MNFMTLGYLLDTYGPRLNMEQLAEVLGVAKGTLYNRISAGTLDVKTYVDGGRWADFRDVAEALEARRETASSNPQA